MRFPVRNRLYRFKCYFKLNIPYVKLGNKTDLAPEGLVESLRDRDFIFISAKGKVTLEELLLHIVEYGRYRRLGSAMTHQTLPRDAELTDGLSESVTGSPPSSSAPFHVSGSSLPTALPGWFRQKDSNGDGQLSMAEYAPTSNRDTVASFQRLDANRDGLLTPKECTHPVKSESDRPAADGLK